MHIAKKADTQCKVVCIQTYCLFFFVTQLKHEVPIDAQSQRTTRPRGAQLHRQRCQVNAGKLGFRTESSFSYCSRNASFCAKRSIFFTKKFLATQKMHLERMQLFKDCLRHAGQAQTHVSDFDVACVRDARRDARRGEGEHEKEWHRRWLCFSVKILKDS